MKNTAPPSFFETILVVFQTIPLIDYHYKRLSNSLLKLGATAISKEEFKTLLLQNTNPTWIQKCRIAIHKNGAIIDFNTTCIEVDRQHIFNKIPIHIDIYQDKYKIISDYSNYKVENDFLYKVAQVFCSQNNINQCVILNKFGRIVETNMSNIYLIKNNKIYTPPLSDGCVNGVFRTLLMSTMAIEEQSFIIEDILDIDEIFLTNAVRGIILVNKIGNKTITYSKSQEIQIQIEKLSEFKSFF